MIFTIALGSYNVWAQLENLHGEFDEYRPGIHSGNQMRCTIWNDGQIGTNNLRQEFIALEWPINSGFAYFGQTMIKVGAEVYDLDGDLVHMFSESNGWRPEDPTDPGSGDMGPDGEWWTFLPLPGFANPDVDRLAMSHQTSHWPSGWPDKMDDQLDPGWPMSWNGYFGKDIKNADQESYFVMDDYNNKEFAFLPDSTDESRRGLGMRVSARGLQWSNALVEDMLFALYDVKNISTTQYDKILFGQFAGPAIGNTVTQGGDNGDDNGAFVLEESLVYSYDEDNLGNTGWTPVGYYGAAFLESPGNPFDGIDNDYDAVDGSGGIIDESMFATTTLVSGQNIVLIDYDTYERRIIPMPDDTLFIKYNDKVLNFHPGQDVTEVEHNLIDDNMNGLIDENNGSEFGPEGEKIRTFLYIGNKYIDYLSGDGTDNKLIDEYRDDGVDNDEDWDVLTDDVGLDGVPFTGDFGEGDGLPTSGWQAAGTLPNLEGPPNKFGLYDTYLPGEPHIDKTDINESDMIGLTSFYLYTPWSLLPAYDDELIWEKTKPGYLDDRSQNSDTDFTFGSGYFPMNVGQIERFSIAHVMGDNLDDLLINKSWGDRAYEENYNFSKAPNVPTVTAIPGNNRVTLVWDTFAEESVDPILGQDFEGYRIYRSTDPGWHDMQQITDGAGSVTYRKPMAQYDLDNEHEGYSPVGVKGVHLWLGDNTGIVNSFVDTTAINGFTYYYAVTSYDHGDPVKGIAPSECTRYIAIDKSGGIEKGSNVAIVRPEAPVSGFVNADLSDAIPVEGNGDATGQIGYKIVNPLEINDNNSYRITFEDTIVDGSNFTTTYATKNMTVVNVTEPSNPDTLINKDPNVQTGDILPITDGFQLQLINLDEMKLDSINSMWSHDSVYTFAIDRFRYSRTEGTPMPNDYQIDFGEVGIDTSVELEVSRTTTLPATPVNFTVTNTTTGENVPFAFWERDVLEGEEGMFTGFTDRTRTDEIIFLEPNENDSLIITWDFELDGVDRDDSTKRNPLPGDYAVIKMLKPFMSSDVYEFTAAGQSVEEAAIDLDRIKVVPNPYIVANSWEPLNPYSNGRGPRELHFTHLPERCTIRIFNVRGQLIREHEHNAPSIMDGTWIWDMQSKDFLDISYGIYIYHVDAGDFGTKIGKFALVK